MKIEKYPVIVGKTSMVFEFTNEGIRGKFPNWLFIVKPIFINFFNLGFGDKDEITGQIDDEVITNNGDGEKVLATVASTLYNFTDKYPEAIIFATGSTKARTRLYRIGITNNLEGIRGDFEIFGLVGETGWQPIKNRGQIKYSFITFCSFNYRKISILS